MYAGRLDTAERRVTAHGQWATGRAKAKGAHVLAADRLRGIVDSASAGKPKIDNSYRPITETPGLNALSGLGRTHG